MYGMIRRRDMAYFQQEKSSEADQAHSLIDDQRAQVRRLVTISSQRVNQSPIFCMSPVCVGDILPARIPGRLKKVSTWDVIPASDIVKTLSLRVSKVMGCCRCRNFSTSLLDTLPTQGESGRIPRIVSKDSPLHGTAQNITNS